jgi:hypothetical protein
MTGQARELLTAVTYVGRPWRGRHLRAFFACMYFAALRPGEVKALRKDGCYLPVIGWGNASRSIPRISRDQRLSRDQRQMAAVGCIWLRSVTSLRHGIGWHKSRSGLVFRGQSGGRGIRTHGDVAATMVFKTIAIGH